MLILRFTTKAFKKFKQTPKLIEVDKSEKDFGEWYVNTADSFNRGNLFMTVMHADSLYTMLIPIEKNMNPSNFVHTIFGNLMLRMLRIEIPQENTERIVKLYGDQAAFSKTTSKKLLGNLNNILQDIEAIVEYCDDVKKKSYLDMARLECRVNAAPRTLNGKYVWPLERFYSCIRKFCPELPHRMTLPLYHYRNSDLLTKIFKDRVPEILFIKIEGSASGAEVLFNQQEVQLMLKVIDDSESIFSDTYGKLYSDLKRMLSFNLKKFGD